MTPSSVDEIKAFFPGFRRCVLKTFLKLVHAIIGTRSCSLYKCAEVIPGDALFESRYKQLLRFVCMQEAERFCLQVGYLLLSLLPAQPVYYVVIDRTNWQFGKFPINLLCLGVLLKGDYYLPLLWVSLPKDGSSSEDERIALLERFCQFWPDPGRCVLLADREFIGRKWISWLRDRGIGMVIRLREDIYLDEVVVSQRQAYAYERIRHAVATKGHFVAPITLAGQVLYYIGLPDQKEAGKVVCLLSDSPDVAWVYQAYGRRWKIEVFFKQLKTDGFNLEDIRVVDINRVRVLMAVASFAYVLALHQGLVEAKKRPIKLKKHAKHGKSWPAVSLFRLGYRWIRKHAGDTNRFVRFVLRLVRKLAQAIRPPTATGRQFAKSVQ